MKRKYHKNSLLIFFFLFICSISIQAQFTIDAQIRPRGVISEGYQHLIPDSSGTAFSISQRTRISFSYANPFLRIRITPQDVRVWGNESVSSSTGVFGNAASLDLFEGYVELKLGSWGWVSIGRQQLKYDREWLLATRNWNQMGIAYDAVVLKTAWKAWKLDIAGSWNSLTEVPYNNLYPSSRIKSLNYAWIHWEPVKGVKASLMQMATGVTRTDTTSHLFWKQTSGICAEVALGNLNTWVNGYYQYGRTNQDLPVSAFLADAGVSYRISFFTPGCGISYLSGNNRSGSGMTTDHLFDMFYGARHRYFGYMDYFTNIPKSTKQGGLIDYNLMLQFTFLKTVTLQSITHYFQLAQTNPNTPNDRNLGFENDFVINYSFTSWGNLEAGYGFLLPTSGFKIMQGVNDPLFAQFGYLQLTIKPTLFTYSIPEKP